MNRKKWMAGVLACVLALALSVPALAAEPLTFSDVPEKHWAHTAIMDMTEKGMFKGTSHAVNGVGTFSPRCTHVPRCLCHRYGALSLSQ